MSEIPRGTVRGVFLRYPMSYIKNSTRRIHIEFFDILSGISRKIAQVAISEDKPKYHEMKPSGILAYLAGVFLRILGWGGNN